MSVFLAPTFGVGYQAFNTNGAVLNGGQIFTYQAGSSTPQATYTTSAGSIANGNPIVLNADGRTPAEIWLTSGQAYKFVLEDYLGNIIATYDNISGINDLSLPLVFNEWLPTNLTPTYVSTTSFTFAGNQTTLLFPNSRVKTVNTGGTIYSTVQTVTYDPGTLLTTIVVSNDIGSLDSGLTTVSYGLLNPVNPSLPGEYLKFNAPVTISAVAIPTIGAQASANITITGSGVTITGFDQVLAGQIRYLKFNGNNNLTNSATLVLPISPTMNVNAGDELVMRSLGGAAGWECIQYSPIMTNYALSTTHVLVSTDKGQRLTCTGTMSLTGTASTLGAGWFCYAENDGTGVLTFSSAGSNIYQVGGSTTGQSSITIPDSGTGANPYNNSMVLITTDGVNFNVCPVSVPHGSTTFLANGAWIAPRGVFNVWLTGKGPGGNGGNGSTLTVAGQYGGGGAGQDGVEARDVLVSVVPGTSYTVTIGPSGGVTSFGVLLSLASGANGSTPINNSVLGGAGYPNGSDGIPSQSSGAGGSTRYVSGGLPKTAIGAGNNGANAPANTGSGGSGGSGVFSGANPGGTGGSGATGYLTVKW
jgi:hypothetical protein